MKMDYSTNVGGRSKKAGSKTGANNTAGNSSGTFGKRRNFQSSKTTAVARENKRFAKTRTRSGRKNAVS